MPTTAPFGIGLGHSCISVEYNGLVLVGQYLAVNMLAHGPRENDFLKILTFAYEVVHRILVGDSYHILLDYRAGVKVSRHIVACSSDYLHPPARRRHDKVLLPQKPAGTNGVC